MSAARIVPRSMSSLGSLSNRTTTSGKKGGGCGHDRTNTVIEQTNEGFRCERPEAHRHPSPAGRHGAAWVCPAGHAVDQMATSVPRQVTTAHDGPDISFEVEPSTWTAITPSSVRAPPAEGALRGVSLRVRDGKIVEVLGYGKRP